MRFWGKAIAACIAALAASGCEGETGDACDRSCLIAMAQGYADALAKADPGGLPLAAEVRYTENGVDKTVGEGIWRTVTASESFRQYFADKATGTAGLFGVYREGDAHALLAVRLKVENRQFVEIEALVARADHRNRIRPEALTASNPAFEEVLPPESRASRERLVELANAYFDGIVDNTNAEVPAEPNCSRRENGTVTLHNPNPETEPCPLRFGNFAYITAIRDRRVGVIDEERGLVWMWVFFDVPGNIPVPERVRPDGQAAILAPDGTVMADTRKIPRSLYIAELFQVRDGKFRDIEAIMFNLDLGSKSGWE